MDKTVLHKIFSRAFDDAKWLEVLQSVFGAKHGLLAQPKDITANLKGNYTGKAKAAYELGSFTTSDDRIIGLYKIEVNPDVWLERNKVGLRELLRDVYKYDVDGAIIVFVQDQKWRLSFVSEIKMLNDEGEVIEQATEPKRYTYLLGEGEKVRTPSERLAALSNKTLPIQDILNAFSVEALNEEFYKIIQAFFYELVGGKVGKGRKQTDYEEGILQLPGVPKDNRQVYQEFAVRLIGRSVFCWFLKMKKSDAGEPLLPESLLASKAVKSHPNYYHSILERVFFQTLNTPMDQRVDNLPEGAEQIPFLNGGLFEPGTDDYYKPNRLTGLSEHLNTLQIPDAWFQAFFEELEKYNFTIDENSVIDIEVSVDPEMLGRIFENLLAEIDPDSGETARKATGSFYTPREIVDFMATESLVQYLHNKTKIEHDRLRPIFKMLEAKDPELTPAEQNSILDALDKVKILDPACGSGAFPMGVLQKIVQALQKLDPEAEWWKQRQVDRISNTIVKKQLREKLESSGVEYARKIGIIQNSLYGVDIQPVAAEISKLRCFLTLIVDEHIDENKPNRGIEPLPNSEFKFVTGDTLMKLPKETDFEGLFNANDDLEQLDRIRQDYLQSYGEEKEKLKETFKAIQDKTAKEQLRHGAADVNSRAWLISTWKPFGHEKSDWFDSKWMFGVEKFDVVIANPPYVQLQKEKGKLAKKYTNQGFKTFFRTGDLYILFLEKGINLLNDTGVLSFINPNTWLQSFSFGPARKFLTRNIYWTEILITDKVFDATVDTHCLIFSKKVNSNPRVTVHKKSGRNIFLSHTISPSDIPTDGSLINIELLPEQALLFKKIQENKLTLGDYYLVYNGVKPFEKGKGKPPQTAEILRAKPFVMKGERPDETWSPLLRGSSIHRYKNFWSRDYWIQYGPWLAAPRDPKIFQAKEKVIVRQTGDSLISTFVGDNVICRNNLHIIIPTKDHPVKPLLALLNSKTLNFYYSILNSEQGEALAEVKKRHLEILPIPNPNKLNCLSRLVDQTLICYSIEKTINLYVTNSHIAQLFQEVIDAMVMELYFKDDFEKAGIAFIKYAERDFESIEGKPEAEQMEIIHRAYQKLREKDNEIRNNLKLMDIKLADIVMPIKSAK